MAILLAAVGLAHTGCRRATPPRFVPEKLALVEHEIVPEHAEQIEGVLIELFGTPDAPRSPEGSGLDLAKLKMAAGAAGYQVVDTKTGKKVPRGLYRQHCAQCHGITGDGYGPSAAVVNAFPRDFRAGVFKFKSTYHAAKPTDDDLRRTVMQGLPGTAMPAFSLLDANALGRDAQENADLVGALVEYVKYLSMRGEVERELIAVVADEFDFDPRTQATSEPLNPGSDGDDAELIEQIVADVARRWQEADEQVLEPDPRHIPPAERTAEDRAASIAAGQKLFLSDTAKCSQCHGATAQGDGPMALTGLQEYDDWNQREIEFRRQTAALAEQVAELRKQHDSLPPGTRQGAEEQLAAAERRLARRQRVEAELLPPQRARPRDLADGVFRGGKRPVDLYRRIHQGIPGTPMPAHGSPRPGVAGALTEEQIWQLVDYVLSLQKTSSAGGGGE